MADEEQKTDAEKLKENEVQEFIKEYGELVKKHGYDFACFPMFVPDGQGGFNITVQNTPIDIRNQPTKSPFVAKE